ncbi:MAG TPA: membrane protein insertase YidC [Polyangiaceae bacterium]|nr:membrane protein insertase YidC [Polyangiaceae bacterium]
MERGNLGRLAFIAVGLFLAFVVVPKWFHGSSSMQPLRPEHLVTAATERPPESFCDIWTDDFHAKLSSRSATLTHFELLHAKYRKKGVPIDLSTTPDVEDRRPLRFDWQNPAVGIPSEDWLVGGNLLDYAVEQSSKTSCEFTYEDARARVTETVRATGRPYELEVTATVTNRTTRPLRQALTVDEDAWRTDKEQKSGLMGVSALVTHVECVSDTGLTTRKRVEDFDADKFKDFPATPLAAGDWFQAPGKPAFGAVSNAYFSQAIVPLAGPTDPACQLQVEERWNASRYRNRKDDPEGGGMFRARLAYAPHEVTPGATETYRVLSYMGPKERSILEAVGGGGHRLIELIDLGFFSAIAKILVAFLLKVHSVVPNWGLAIIVLTITARTLLFPLTLPSVKQMIRMRELKPEMDVLNEKFKDDAQAKGLAQMELWRKHSVNPLKGCLPQMASMPVWFALYTTLQTAVELYNIPFLWFPDLSGPDPLFILPFVIGATNFLQQKLMPMQGDPAQQKMMLYLMPGMFIVMMLFLPSGLGVYMFTNGLLGIAQQQLVERHAKRAVAQGKKA